MRMLAKDPEERPRSAASLARILDDMARPHARPAASRRRSAGTPAGRTWSTPSTAQRAPARRLHRVSGSPPTAAGRTGEPARVRRPGRDEAVADAAAADPARRTPRPTERAAPSATPARRRLPRGTRSCRRRAVAAARPRPTASEHAVPPVYARGAGRRRRRSVAERCTSRRTVARVRRARASTGGSRTGTTTGTTLGSAVVAARRARAHGALRAARRGLRGQALGAVPRSRHRPQDAAIRQIVTARVLRRAVQPVGCDRHWPTEHPSGMQTTTARDQ